MKKIKFQDTSFRDGFQSCFGARVITEDFLPAVEASVEAGITHFEAGGGARFQSLFFYCGESAFSMMDKFRKTVGPDINLQTLARGISVVALSAQPRDIIDLHAKMFKKHGMTTIRNFDALNDVRNLKYSGECITNAGLNHEIAITLMDLPPGCEGAHDVSFYIKVLKDILESEVPFSSIAFKDASGTANPQKVYGTIKQARDILGKDAHISFHSHDTAGVGISQYLAAINGGADQIDLCKSPVSGGTCQPDIISMWHAMKGSGYTLDIDVNKVLKAVDVFEKCMEDYFFPPEAKQISCRIPLSPMPGGALTANTMMMRDTGTLNLYPDVIKAMSECVAKGGFGTSVTPVSQFYFQQAYANVTQGPWKKITQGYGNMVLGYFGKTPVRPDGEVIKIAEDQMGKPFFEGDPVDLIEDGIPKAKKILADNNLEITDENIFIVASCESKGVDFLKGNFTTNIRKKSKEDTSPKAAAPAPQNSEVRHYSVAVNGQNFEVSVGPSGQKIVPAKTKNEKAENSAKSSSSKQDVKAQLPGNVLRIEVAEGQSVEKDQVLIVLEAMKMETPVKAPQEGKVTAIHVQPGQTVSAGDLLLTI